MRSVKTSTTVSIAACFTTLVGWAAHADDRPAGLLGFTPQSSQSQRELERQFDSQLNADELRAWLKQLSSAPNHVGAPHNKANAEFIERQFKAWGWDAHIETFDVLYPTLKHHKLELIAPNRFVASLKEPPVPGDSTSTRTDGVPPYNAYGGDGDVTGELVYVNYGMPNDYKDLARRNIDVKGKIVIARYGGGWRGLKPKLAQEHGALGCIIYSDPRDDGYFEGDVYPRGGNRPPGGVQRGSVMDMTTYPGDPLTPGVAATKNAHRLSRNDAKTILKIPVLPISYADAQPFLRALQGPVAPENWRGALPFTYHMGPGPAKVHLQVQSNWDLKTLYDVIATIPGKTFPNEWVIRGNHRDAWVFGASDPLSGTIALMAEAKAIGAQLKTGWRPQRTIVYASWDGEEPGLIGSTEWVEEHAKELSDKTVLYLNSDSNARGFLRAGGNLALQHFVNEASRDVTDPEKHVSVRERLGARLMVESTGKGVDEQIKRAAEAAVKGHDLPIFALGSGSDYSPFLQHLGVNTLSISYGGEDEEAGSYHSNYDSFYHYSHFGDPTFAYGVAEAQTVGRLVLRMADAAVLPLRFGATADTFATYVKELHQLSDSKRKQSEHVDSLLDRKAFELASDPTKPVGPPEREPSVPYLELAPLDNAVARLQTSAKKFDEAYKAMMSRDELLDTERRTELNAILRRLESALTDARGLPMRPWYRHLIYAPGLLTGYGVKTMPGVREAIEDNRWQEANEYAVMTADAINRYSERLDRATALLK